MSDLNDLLRLVQANTYGWSDDASKRAIASFRDASSKINLERDISPQHVGKVRHSLEFVGISIMESDISNLVRLSQDDPTLFKFIYDVIKRSISVLDKQGLGDNWKEEYYISSIVTRATDTDYGVSDIMDHASLRDYKEKSASDAFHDFWDREYDAVYAITVQFKKKVVHASTQPIISYVSAHSMRRDVITSKDFLSIECVDAA